MLRQVRRVHLPVMQHSFNKPMLDAPLPDDKIVVHLAVPGKGNLGAPLRLHPLI
jgi:hypothetical protein